MKQTTSYTNRFPILKGGKISLVVSALLLTATITTAEPVGCIDITINTATDTAIQACDGYTTFITDSGSIAVSSTDNIAAIYNITTLGDNTRITNSSTIQATSESGSASGIEVGDMDGNASIANSGTITATSTSESASGIEVYYMVGNATITNSGIIQATSTNRYAYGIFVDEDMEHNATITNLDGGIIQATSTNNEAFGIYVGYAMYGNAKIMNSGTITATSTNSYAHGIHLTEGTMEDNAKIINSGTITATSESGSASGIYVDNMMDNASIANSGTITATSESGSASGIEVDDIEDRSIIANSGTITATSTGGNAHSYAHGIKARSILEHNATITNLDGGIIQATSESRSAIGIYVGYTMHDNAKIINSGTITATSESGSASGIGVDRMTDNASITNSGTITATSTGGSAYGIDVGSMEDNAKIINSGTITATSESGSAYGIDVGIIRNNATIINSGTISATIDNKADKNAFSIKAFLSGTTNNTYTDKDHYGKLYGNIDVTGDGTLTNSGLISLPHNANGSDSAKIDNFHQTATGILQIGLNTAADGNVANNYSQLKTERATFDDGSTIDVDVLNAEAGQEILGGKTLNDVVSANSESSLTIEGTLNITDNSALLDFEYVKDGKTIDLNIIEGSTILDSVIAGEGSTPARAADEQLDVIKDDLENYPAMTKGSTPVRAAAEQLDVIKDELENYPAMTKGIEDLNTLQTDTQVAQAVESITPQAGNAVSQGASQISNGIASIVTQRQNIVIGGGLNAGDDTFADKSFWMKGFGSYGNQDNKESIKGFSLRTQGIGIGIDDEYKAGHILGLGLFYTNGRVDVNELNQRSDLEVFTALVYGHLPVIDDKTKFLYQLGYAWQQTDTQRMDYWSNSAVAGYTAFTLSIDLKLAREYQVNERLLLQPIVETIYRQYDTPSYSETGTSNFMYSYDSSTSNELLLGLQTIAYYKVDDTSKVVGNINVRYDLIHDAQSVTSEFLGATGIQYKTDGIDNGRWLYDLGIGYDRDVKEGHNINFSYNYQGQGSTFDNHVGSFKYIYSF